jgi:P-type E1-E2 ATPase
MVLRDTLFVEVLLGQVVVGDHVLVRPGDVVSIDGRVVTGESSVDESSLTGESMLIEKVAGDMVYTGTTNQDGALQVETLKAGEDSAHGKIVRLIKNANLRGFLLLSSWSPAICTGLSLSPFACLAPLCC